MIHSLTKSPILLVDDETSILLSYSVMLKSAGFADVVTLDDSRKVIPFLAEYEAAIIVLDLSMPFITGEELLRTINQEYPQIPVIIITATNEIETAVNCMKNGAADYIVKPVEKSRFLASIRKALEIKELKNELSSLKEYLLTDELKNPDNFSEIITHDKKMHAIFKYIEVIADSPYPVLIIGETGVGKELIAKAIHKTSQTKGKFVAVNVAGLDDTMFSDTLFGHKKGAFTSADASRDGLISQAAEGILFLDEIGDLSLQSQVKLLRLIQEKEYYQLGSDVPKKSDARIIVALNKNLKSMVADGQFRKDLYFRLSAHQIDIPPLKERKGDLPLLLNHFFAEAAESLKKKKPAYPKELITLLSAYDFPGNIRELQALIFDAVSRHESGVLSTEHFRHILSKDNLPQEIHGSALDEGEVPGSDFFTEFPTLKQAEEFLINQALKKAGGNQGITASLLGISRQALNKRLLRKKKD